MQDDPTHPAQPYKFSATSVTIQCGGTVKVTNTTAVSHTFDPQHGGFTGTGTMPSGASRSVSFFYRGDFGFMCSFHHWMTGTVHVT
jgi:plastocyanin